MDDDGPVEKRSNESRLFRGLRFDAVIAVCALLISSLTAVGSWWQTRVIQAQLGAQVWPYVTVSVDINANTVQMAILNEGLGPAELESASITVDGRPEPGFIEVLHAILGPNLVARKPHNERIALSLSSGGPGDVIRPGDSDVIFSLTSKHYATPFLAAYPRIVTTICYCSIIPNTCWLRNSKLGSRPQPRRACDEVPHDLLHAPLISALTHKF